MLTLPLILAAISAGLIGGFHCVGMCGGIASILSRLPSFRSAASTVSSATTPILNVVDGSSVSTPRRVIPIAAAGDILVQAKSDKFTQLSYQIQLHTGRLATYALIGAVFGGIGAASLRWKLEFPITSIFFVVGNIALIILGLRLLGVRLHLLVPNILNEKIQGVYARVMPNLQKASAHPLFLGMAWGSLPCGLSYAIAPFALLSGAAWSGAILMLLFGLAALPHLLIAQAMSKTLKQHSLMLVVQYLFAAILIGFGLFGLFYFDMKNMPEFLCITPI